MSKTPDKLFVLLICLISVLFLVLYFTLSIHSRIAGDDFFYLWLTNTFGAWDGMIYQYKEWSGRWSAHFVGCTLISHWKNPLFLPFINLVTIALLIISLRSGLKKIFSSLGLQKERLLLSAFTILLTASFSFLSYNIGETWYWYIIILTYLWSLIAFIFILNILFSYCNSLLNYFLLTILSLYIGGASESYAIIFLTLLILLLIYRWKVLKENFSVPVNKMILFSLLVISISFSFSVFAPGTEVRYSLLPQTGMLDKLLVACKAFVKYFIRYLPSKVDYIIIFSSPWIFFGAYFLKNQFDKKQLIKFFRIVTGLFLLCLAIMFIPTSFVMSETGPDRALSVISILTAVYFAIAFSLSGIFINFEKRLVKNSLYGILLISIAILINDIYYQNKITKNFADACDVRIRYIEKIKESNFTGILELNKIPSKGMLYWDELSADTSYFTNKHLKNGLGLSFSVRLMENK